LTSLMYQQNLVFVPHPENRVYDAPHLSSPFVFVPLVVLTAILDDVVVGPTCQVDFFSPSSPSTHAGCWSPSVTLLTAAHCPREQLLSASGLHNVLTAALYHLATTVYSSSAPCLQRQELWGGEGCCSDSSGGEEREGMERTASMAGHRDARAVAKMPAHLVIGAWGS
jgi:hypothetical protein